MDDGFKHFYKINNNDENKNKFGIIFVIISGRLFRRYIKKIKENIIKIINIPYTYILLRIILNQYKQNNRQILNIYYHMMQ